MSSRESSVLSKLVSTLFKLVFTDNSEMNNIRTIVNRILTIIIVLVFTMSGFMKLSSRFSYETHVHLQREFHRYASVFPARVIGYTPDPHNYRTVVAVSEIALAILLLMGTKFMRRVANHLLLLIMIGAFTTHCLLGDPVAKVIPPMVMVFLIAWRHFTTGIFISLDAPKQD
eukprot:TRINITY_DN17140_c0_g1_i1.p1 TRINITY_DN17140_c0_g1~~TRINITY_DN17140_c0_g1_i1.p1  ORF type:complete len:182 (+),score=20.27 TRINITY_DN17140_c0_g1_i1:31-546(+)